MGEVEGSIPSKLLPNKLHMYANNAFQKAAHAELQVSDKNPAKPHDVNTACILNIADTGIDSRVLNIELNTIKIFHHCLIMNRNHLVNTISTYLRRFNNCQKNHLFQ